MGRFHLPMAHRPAMQVPQGGSSCANCRFYVAGVGTHGACSEPNFVRYYNTSLIPCPPDSFCSDWYEPNVVLDDC